MDLTKENGESGEAVASQRRRLRTGSLHLCKESREDEEREGTLCLTL